MATALDLRIRPVRLDEADYNRFVALSQAIEPDQPDSLEDIKFWLENTPASLERRWFLAERSGEAVGFISTGRRANRYHPQKFSIYVAVHPQYRRQGLGSALYTYGLRQLEPFNPIMLMTSVNEGRPCAVQFAESRGFIEEARFWESRLDVEMFDPSPYAALLEKVNADAIELRSLAAIMPGTPDYKQRMYDLDCLLSPDEPLPEPPTKPEVEPWLKNYFDHPHFSPASILIALDGDTWVGLSELRPTSQAGIISNWFTALRREYRGRGLATAMKVMNIVWARANGYREIRTGNSTLNTPMLKINEALGFKKQAAYIGFRKDIEATK